MLKHKNNITNPLFISIIILIFTIFPVRTIYGVEEPPTTILPSSGADSVKSFSKIIIDSTPKSIANPIIKSLSWLEDVRKNAGVMAKEKTDELKKEVDKIDARKPDGEFINGGFYKSLKHAQLLIYSLISSIINTKIIFYIVFPLGVIFSLRFIWGFIF